MESISAAGGNSTLSLIWFLSLLHKHHEHKESTTEAQPEIVHTYALLFPFAYGHCLLCLVSKKINLKFSITSDESGCEDQVICTNMLGRALPPHKHPTSLHKHVRDTDIYSILSIMLYYRQRAHINASQMYTEKNTIVDQRT